MKNFFLVLFSLLVVSSSNADIADDILKNYQSNLYNLPLIQQEHFSTRMYGLTGQKQYLFPVNAYLILLSERFHHLSANLNNQERISAESRRLTLSNPLDSDKKRLRLKRIKQFPNIAFDLNFLILLHKIYFYSIENTAGIQNLTHGKNYLESRLDPLKKFILDEKNIKIYGAQLINYVYFLKHLGFIDLRQVYTEQFKKTFQDKDDNTLTDAGFSAKIYGMTHFILADSNYYQRESVTKSLEWITHYFDKHIDEIIQRAENDIIIEVGICYLLLNKKNAEAVKKIKSYLMTVYDEKHHMIPNKENSFDLIKGEHRNILTIMFFKWPNKLISIPNKLFQTFLSSGYIVNENKKINYGFNLIFS